jgi:hypothetical protein
MCSQYHRSGNWLDYDGKYNWFKDNVHRTDCMVKTGDDWCSACNSSSPGAAATCTACYGRGSYNDLPAGTPPIVMDARTKKVRARAGRLFI